jgi:hypothetical protein
MLRHPPCSSRRLLQTVDARIPGIPPADPPSGVSSDVVVILAALLCALICVVGLVAVARCARSRRNSTNATTNHSTTSSSPAHSAAAFGGGHTHATPTAFIFLISHNNHGLPPVVEIRVASWRLITFIAAGFL